MYLCEVAIVSQLCISFPYILHGLCEDYLTCDIAFNAVMPLSRASTRGRYSRIEGVTFIELLPELRCVTCTVSSAPANWFWKYLVSHEDSAISHPRDQDYLSL